MKTVAAVSRFYRYAALRRAVGYGPWKLTVVNRTRTVHQWFTTFRDKAQHGPNFPLLGNSFQRLCDRGAFVLNDTGCSDVWRTDVE